MKNQMFDDCIFMIPTGYLNTNNNNYKKEVLSRWGEFIEYVTPNLEKDDRYIAAYILENTLKDLILKDDDSSLESNDYIKTLFYNLKIYSKCKFRKFLDIQSAFQKGVVGKVFMLHNELPKCSDNSDLTEQYYNKVKEIQVKLPWKLPIWIQTDEDIKIFVNNLSKQSSNTPYTSLSMESYVVEVCTRRLDINVNDNLEEMTSQIATEIDNEYIQQLLDVQDTTTPINGNDDIYLIASKLAIKNRRTSGEYLLVNKKYKDFKLDNIEIIYHDIDTEKLLLLANGGRYVGIPVSPYILYGETHIILNNTIKDSSIEDIVLMNLPLEDKTSIRSKFSKIIPETCSNYMGTLVLTKDLDGQRTNKMG